MGRKNKKSIKFLYRLALVAMSAVMCLSTFSVLSFAEDSGEDLPEKVAVDEARFCSKEFTAENAVMQVNDDGTVSMSAMGASPKVSMTVTPLKAATSANALRIVVKTTSDFENMEIEYIYKNSAQLSVPGEASVVLEKSDSAVEYIIPMAYADSMTHLVLEFSGSGKLRGTVEMISIAAISYGFDNRTYYGAVSGNRYDHVTGDAEFAGSISYETTLENSDGRVVLYRLDQNETVGDVSFAHAQVANIPMTLSFKFSWKITDTADLCSRYFAAVLTKDNKIIPLTPATYLKSDSANEELSGDENDKNNFKGIETTFYAGAAESGSSVAFVDVYLNRLESGNGDGYQYVLDEGEEYYFDRLYIAELDAVMKSYSLSGVSVYLRLLVDDYDGSFGYIKNASGAELERYFAVDPCSDEIIGNLFACSDFVVSRYSSGEFGNLDGVVLGRSVDNADVYNYCTPISMSSYADKLARYYSIIKTVTDKNGGGLEILLPFSDTPFGIDRLIDLKARDQHYPADLLAKSVVKAIHGYGIDVSALRFVLESESLPDCVKRADSSDESLGADRCYLFSNMIKKLSTKYEGLSSDIIFCWFPSADISYYELMVAYMYNYNVLACSEGVRGYVLSLFERTEEHVSGADISTVEKNIYSLIKSTYKYADTDSNAKFGMTALAATGKKNWNEVIKNYSAEKVVKRTLEEKNAEYVLPENVKGSYKMWDFSTSNGSNGWTKYDGCSSLSVYSPAEVKFRALVASFDGEVMSGNGSDYGSIVYRPTSSLWVKNISNISLDLMILSDFLNEADEGMFEVKITVGSGDTTRETTGVVKGNVETAVYADIANISKVDYIKIGLRSLDGKDMSDVEMCLRSVSIHSGTYNNEELESIVVSGEITGDDEFVADSRLGSLELVAIFTGACVLILLAFWGVFALRNKKRK